MHGLLFAGLIAQLVLRHSVSCTALGAAARREAGPWVDVCLKAYYVPGDQHTLAERRRYMIFDSAMTPQRLGQGAQAAA